MTGFRKLIKRLLNLGVYKSTSTVNRRRIKLVNSFNLAGGLIILAFFLVNCLVGTYAHAIKIISGLFFLTIPVFVLNKSGYNTLAKFYFAVISLVFGHYISFQSIFDFQQRDNEFFFLGYSTLIVALFDNPAKRTLFVVTVASVILMKITRLNMLDQLENTDAILSITNLLLGFVCVYFFTDIFKNDLIKSEKRITKFALNTDKQSLEIKRQKDALEANKELLNTTIDNIPVFIAMLDPTGKFIMANQRFSDVLLKPRNEIEGVHFADVFEKEIADLARPVFQNAVDGRDAEINHPFTFPSGDFIHAFGKYIPLFNAHNQVSRILVYVIDIKELKASERALRDLNTSKNKIMSILSHDLRSPITSLRSLLDISDDLDEKSLRMIINNVGRQVETLGFTLNNILNWVKTQLEGFKTSQQFIEVNALVSQSIDLYQHQLEQKNISLNNDISHNAKALVDPNHFSMIIRNLLNNAIKFTPENGTIAMSSTSQNGHLCLEIKDSGMGMDQSVVETVLNPIAQIKPISSLGTNGEKGTGLGLGFCNDMLLLNGGTMEINSKKGQGTVIKVSIPKG